MKIKDFAIYHNGIIEIQTTRGVFCLTESINENNHYSIFDGYPTNNFSNIIEHSGELKTQIVNALENYNPDVIYRESVKRIINKLK